MHIRCPHCGNPIEVLQGASFSEVNCPSCGSTFSLISGDSTETHRAGTRRIAHFELLRELGVGKFGSVWMARDTKLDRSVAIKIPRKGALNAEETELFLRDARAAAQLKHPHIVSVHEVGREHDTVYIVSDYVEGANLRERLSAGRLSFRESAELVVTLAEAVHHAHQAGVIHRDLKPGNIMLDRDGHPHVIDFGLAKRDAGEITMTLDGHILGTPAYMPPEQAGGKGHQADRRSDVYSVGVILFELLTGELPFRGEKQMLLVQIQRDEPPRPRRLNGRIPRDLETITLKCMEKEPSRRYPTAQHLADDLKRWLDGRPIVARPVGPLERGWRWCRRNPGLAGLSAAVVLALVSGTAVSAYFAVDAVSQKALAEEAAESAIDQKNRADRKTDEALANAREAIEQKESVRGLLYAANMRHAQRAFIAGDTGRVLELLKQGEPLAGERDLRGWEWHFQQSLCHDDLRTFDGHAAALMGASFSSDGRQLVSAGRDGTVKVWNATTGQELRTFEGGDSSVSAAAFSRDGRRLAVADRAERVKLWDLETADQPRIFPGHVGLAVGVALSSDGKLLATAGASDSSGQNGIIRLWDLDSDSEVRTFEADGLGLVGDVAFSPDNRLLAGVTASGTMKLWEVKTGGEFGTSEARIANLARFSSDGRTLAIATLHDAVILWDIAARKPRGKLVGQTGLVSSIAFNPDSSLVATASSDNSTSLWNVENQGQVRVFRGHTGTVTSVAFSPDGRQLVSAGEDKTVKLWDTTRINYYIRPSIQNTEDLTCVAFSPDGRWFASFSGGAAIKLCDSETGTAHRMLELRKGGKFLGRMMLFSPDGRLLAMGGSFEKPSADKPTSGIELWEIESGKQLRSLEGSKGAQYVHLAFHPDGQTLAAATHEDQSIDLWTVGNGQRFRTLDGAERVRDVAFSPDGGLLASADSDGTTKLWHFVSGAFVRAFEGHADAVLSVTFSPDGKTLATASVDRTIKLWNAETGALKKTLRAHTDWATSVAFSADGRRLVSGSNDHGFKLWDAETGTELFGWVDSGNVDDVSWSSDGRWLRGCVWKPDRPRHAVLLDSNMPSADEKMGRFVARGIVEQHPTLDDAIGQIEKQADWNDAMRTAAIEYVKKMNGQ